MTATIPALDLAPRVHSRDPQDHPVPTGREEAWRFTPLARLGGVHDGTRELDTAPSIAADVSGFVVETVEMDDSRVGLTMIPADIVSARAMDSSRQATVLTLAAESQGQASVVIDAHGAGTCHIVIELGAMSEGTVVLRHTGAGTLAENLEIRVGPGARATVVSLQEGDREAVHVATHHAQLDRDATLTMGHVTLGGDLVRICPQVSYVGPGGSAELLGLTFADAGQFHESRVFVDHDTPHCRSSVLYKTALQGEGAHTVWVGDVLVRADAVGIDTYEMNRNLLLTDGARADSVPNLELETGEIVGAGHASATGRFDDEQLFYLQARGIPADIARLLVVRGFFADVLSRLGVESVAVDVMAQVDQRLGVDLDGIGIDAGDDE